MGMFRKDHRIWLYEGLPSSRSDEGLANSRWGNLSEAISVAQIEALKYRDMGHDAYWLDHDQRANQAFGGS